LLYRKILADVAVSTGAQRRMHLFLIVAHSGKSDDRKSRIDFANKRDERDAVYLGHLEIDNRYFAVMVSEPDGCLETFGERFAGVAFLTEISDEKACDTGIII